MRRGRGRDRERDRQTERDRETERKSHVGDDENDPHS